MRIVDSEVFAGRLADLEHWLWTEGAAGLGLPPPPVETLARRVEELSDVYTIERERIAAMPRRGGHLLPRLLYFLCSDAPKVHVVLRELAERGELDGRELRRVVDVGCGVGASSAGLLLSLERSGPRGGGAPAIMLRGLDLDPAVLTIWSAVVGACAAIADVEVRIEPEQGDLRSAEVHREDDLVLCQAALNECLGGGEPSGTASVEGSLSAVCEGVASLAEAALVGDGERYPQAIVDRVRAWASQRLVILIEPALRIVTRPLHALRDAILAAEGGVGPAHADEGDGATGRGGVRVLAPCPHQRPCPMLAMQRDWCHEVRPWTPTPRVGQVQMLTRRRDDRIKYSFVVLGPMRAAAAPLPAEGGPSAASSGVEPSIGMAPATGAQPVHRSGHQPHTPVKGRTPQPADGACEARLVARLVSDPLPSKGKVERFVCTAQGALLRLRVLDRERSDANALLATAQRGTMVSISGPPRNGRVDRECRVRAEGSEGPSDPHGAAGSDR